MIRACKLGKLLAVWLAGLCCATVTADEIRVAVATNFSGTIKILASRFEEQTGHKILLAFGSTGKHYAQIVNGAPFDLFLAADRRRPQRLEDAGSALPGSRFTYATGRLALWSPLEGLVDPEGKVLADGAFHHLAIANPKLAPYGRAAEEVLTALGLWERLANRRVRGENIGQTFQFVASGNAELGFVALSQIHRPGSKTSGSWWEVPQELYSPILQQGVLLTDRPAAREFVAFVTSEQAKAVIREFGYDI